MGGTTVQVFFCREAHPVSSRQCKRYCLELDILQLANSQFISLGNARRELLFRQKDGGANTYASSLHFRSSTSTTGNKAATLSHLSQPSIVSSCSYENVTSSITVCNRFSVLKSVSSSASLAKPSTTSSAKPSITHSPATQQTPRTKLHIVEVHERYRYLFVEECSPSGLFRSLRDSGSYPHTSYTISSFCATSNVGLDKPRRPSKVTSQVGKGKLLSVASLKTNPQNSKIQDFAV